MSCSKIVRLRCRRGGRLARRDGHRAIDVSGLRKRAVLEGPEAALERKRRLTPPVPPKVDGRVEAHITKLACSTPPAGRCRWTLRLLAERIVELAVVDSLSHETVRRTPRKTA